MTDYQIKWTETAIQSLEKIERDLAQRILKRVNGLSVNPFRYIKRLKAVPMFSLRVGIYRVLMSIERNNLVIVAIDVGKRENVYDDL
ncbi:MAG: type II toxin-antitoxin system RelE/ParE family toxin [Thermoplasmataceae archaeon]